MSHRETPRERAVTQAMDLRLMLERAYRTGDVTPDGYRLLRPHVLRTAHAVSLLDRMLDLIAKYARGGEAARQNKYSEVARLETRMRRDGQPTFGAEEDAYRERLG